MSSYHQTYYNYFKLNNKKRYNLLLSTWEYANLRSKKDNL